MTPAPRFFARLAPWAGQGQGSVRAAVTPRFAAPEVGDGRWAVGADPIATPEGVNEPAIGGGVDVDSETTRRSDSARERQHQTALSKERRDGVGLESELPLPTAPVVDVPSPMKIRGAVHDDSPHAPPKAASPASDAQTIPGKTIVERITLVESPDRRESPVKPDREFLPAAMAARGPLRPESVAHRASPPRASSPTVVEITIDRIDVRVPAASATARPAKTRAAPTQSLADYLRHRDQGGA